LRCRGLEPSLLNALCLRPHVTSSSSPSHAAPSATSPSASRNVSSPATAPSRGTPKPKQAPASRHNPKARSRRGSGADPRGPPGSPTLGRSGPADDGGTDGMCSTSSTDLPGLHTLIYLSCGYEALERETRILVGSGVWEVASVVAFLFFPGTNSLETLTIFRRVGCG
jgi:hypothetical protein